MTQNPNANRVLSVEMDERSIIKRSDIVEMERVTAINDLLAQNFFSIPHQNYKGPYHLELGIHDKRLEIRVRCDGTKNDTIVKLLLHPFHGIVKDYFLICESYYDALRRNLSQLEAIDMGRRGIHNEAASILIDMLDGRIELDHNTARRLFTLICVLHIKGF